MDSHEEHSSDNAAGESVTYTYPLTHHTSHAAHHRSYYSQTKNSRQAEVQVLYTDVFKRSTKCKSEISPMILNMYFCFLILLVSDWYLCIKSMYSTLLNLYVVLLSFLQQERVAGGVPLFQWIWKMKAEEGIAGNVQEEMEARNSKLKLSPQSW